jgi:hypothetical protein
MSMLQSLPHDSSDTLRLKRWINKGFWGASDGGKWKHGRLEGWELRGNAPPFSPTRLVVDIKDWVTERHEAAAAKQTAGRRQAACRMW